MSNEEKWILQLTLINERGQSFHQAVRISEDIMQQIQRIDPPSFSENFDGVCKIIKRKEFRKNLFVEQSTTLGRLLAAYMEDKEGWHGEDRKERINAAHAIARTEVR